MKLVCVEIWKRSRTCFTKFTQMTHFPHLHISTNTKFSLIPIYSDAPKSAFNKRKLQINNKFSSIQNKSRQKAANILMVFISFREFGKYLDSKFKYKNTQTQIYTCKNAVNTANIILSVCLPEIGQN